MKILIDSSNLYAGGGIQVAISFLRDLNVIDHQFKIYVVLSANSSSQLEKKAFSENFTFFDLSETESGSIFKRRSVVKKIESQVKPDCIFTIFGPSYHKSKYKKIVGFARGHILYPNSPYFKSLSFLRRFRQKMKNIFHSVFFLLNSDVLIFETQDALEKFQKIGKKKSFYVSNCLNSVFLDNSNWTPIVLPRRRKRIVCVTASYPHKNLSIIGDIIEALIKEEVDDFSIVLTISKDELLIDEKLLPYIDFIGKVKVEELPSLYSQCDILLSTTLLEIFSVTYLEAMYMGKPIVSSDLSFARDVCGDAALYCDAVDANSYAQAIVKLLKDKKLERELVDKGYKNLERFGTSMDRSKKYLNIIAETIKN